MKEILNKSRNETKGAIVSVDGFYRYYSQFAYFYLQGYYEVTNGAATNINISLGQHSAGTYIVAMVPNGSKVNVTVCMPGFDTLTYTV